MKLLRGKRWEPVVAMRHIYCPLAKGALEGLVILPQVVSEVGGRVLWRGVGQHQFASVEKAVGKVGGFGFGLSSLL